MTKNELNLSSTYELGEVVGRGAYSEVVIARRISEEFRSDSDTDLSPNTVAIKRINKSRLITSEERSMPQREIENHETIGKHPNAVYMYESYEDEDNVFLVLEMVEGGTLEDKIKRNPLGVSSQVARDIIYPLLKAVQHLHELSLVHVDISPKNILLDTPNGTVKLCDFGMTQSSSRNSFSASIDDSTSCTTTTIYGTHGYTAPEVLSGQPIDEKADIWSIGMVCYELLTGISPVQLLLDCEEIRFPQEFWVDKPKELLDFTQMLLRTNPLERPSIGEALSHPWFSKQ